MKLQRTTWMLVCFALILGGGVYFWERQGSTQTQATQSQQPPLFDFTEDQIQSLTVTHEDRTLAFERTQQDTQPWHMKAPDNVSASEPAIAFLLNLLVEGKAERSFAIAADQLGDYGLDDPFATVTVTVDGIEAEQRLILGRPNFDEKYLYARKNPSQGASEDVEVFLVPIEFKYAVERDYDEWKQAAEGEDKEDTEDKGEEEANNQ
jgi:hypothetical protein